MTAASRSRVEFELQLSDQHWLGERHEQARDGCSHGRITATIGGSVVTSERAEYGISQSALTLLRTLEADHSPEHPVNHSHLLCHGCGYPVSFGCSNFGTDWVVRHEGDQVVLSQLRHFDSLAGDREFDFEVRLGGDDYRRQILSFAESARNFYFAAEPRSLEPWERELHEQFWAEFDQRLARAGDR